MAGDLVVVDGSCLGYEHGGFLRFGKGLIRELPRCLSGERLEVWSEGKVKCGPRGVVKQKGEWPCALAESGARIFHDLTNGNQMSWSSVFPRSCRLVLTLHDVIPSSLARNGSDRGYREGLMRLLERASAVVTVSESAKAEIVRLFGIDPGMIRVVYPGVARFAPVSRLEARRLSARLGVRAESCVVLTVGTNREYKNLGLLISALPRLKDALGDVQLVIAGHLSASVLTGWYLRAYQLGAKDEIVFAGRVSDDELGLLYHAADVFAYPSRIEGFGMPPVEAVLCGTPVVVSDIPAFQELLHDAGPLVSPGNSAEWVDAIVGVARKGRAAGRPKLAERRLSRLTWRRCAEAYSGVYREVLGGGGVGLSVEMRG